jgi:hypothetical protein
MNRADQLIEKGADGLRRLSEQMAARGGVGEKVAEVLAEDAAFLRQLKPSLMAARARGEAPTNQKPNTNVAAPTGPQVKRRPKPPGSGPNPWIVVGAALAVGIAVAKMIDWRSHAHPRD